MPAEAIPAHSLIRSLFGMPWECFFFRQMFGIISNAVRHPEQRFAFARIFIRLPDFQKNVCGFLALRYRMTRAYQGSV
jgi:hypothetical protein